MSKEKQRTRSEVIKCSVVNANHRVQVKIYYFSALLEITEKNFKNINLPDIYGQKIKTIPS